MTIGYIISFLFSIGLLIAYCILVKNKEIWMTMLYVCVSIVNLGYTLLSAARTLEIALLGNDVAYLGSVFLSMCMFFTIVRLCGFNVKKVHVIIGVTLGVLMFSIVALTDLIPWYYKSVALEMIDGSAKLVKEYGPLHPVYTVYLIGYFVVMIGVIVHSARINKMGDTKFAGFIAGVVCGNIIVWLFEKFVSWEYEFLSLTYIASEIMLLLVYWMMQDYVHKRDLAQYAVVDCRRSGIEITALSSEEKIEKILHFVKADAPLAIREREVLELILKNKKRKDIASELCISENTVKTYTRKLYSKLGVTSREELYELLLQNDT